MQNKEKFKFDILDEVANSGCGALRDMFLIVKKEKFCSEVEFSFSNEEAENIVCGILKRESAYAIMPVG